MVKIGKSGQILGISNFLGKLQDNTHEKMDDWAALKALSKALNQCLLRINYQPSHYGEASGFPDL